MLESEVPKQFLLTDKDVHQTMAAWPGDLTPPLHARDPKPRSVGFERSVPSSSLLLFAAIPWSMAFIRR
jgi:hypothetical protein